MVDTGGQAGVTVDVDSDRGASGVRAGQVTSSMVGALVSADAGRDVVSDSPVSEAPLDSPAELPCAPVSDAVAIAEILVDSSGRLGPLSYLVPADVPVQLGDAVSVPFGKSTRYGVVLGLQEATASTRRASKATKFVSGVYGPRISTDDVHVVRALADLHMTDLAAIGPRLAPRNGKGVTGVDAGPVVLNDGPPMLSGVDLDVSVTRRLYVRAPAVDPARLAAVEAARLAQSRTGQVLVLCPTRVLAERVEAEFISGAARLDAAAGSAGWKGFTQGTVTVGIGTRAAALYSPVRLAGVVVVEEDGYGLIEQTQPAWNARDVAIVRASAARAALTLISAAPSPEAMGAVQRGVQVGPVSAWPSVQVVDRSSVDPASRAVPVELRRALAASVRRGVTPVVVTSSISAVRRCTGCGVARPCPTCPEGSVTACTHPVTTCDCGAQRTRLSGWDKSRVRAALGRGDVQVVTVSELASLSDVGTVVVFDLDAALSRPDLLGEYGGWRLLTEAARAAGPRGRVIVVTMDPQHVFVEALRQRDALSPARLAWQQARELSLPPFGRLVVVRCGQERKPRVWSWPGKVSGPTKVAGEWEILVRCSTDELAGVRAAVDRLRRGGKVRVRVS